MLSETKHGRLFGAEHNYRAKVGGYKEAKEQIGAARRQALKVDDAE